MSAEADRPAAGDRAGFVARAERLIAATGPERPLALILIDLGDVDGPAQAAALARLDQAAPEALVAGLRAGTLAALTPAPREALDTVARALVAATGRSVASAGVAPRAPGGSLEGLLAEADHALREAKRLGSGICAFTPEMIAAVAARRRLTDEIAAAASGGAFEQVYQPQIALQPRGERPILLGFEALTRWRRPEGEASTGAFVAAAEADGGLIRDIDLWGLRRASFEMAAWIAAGAAPAAISVNMSPSHFSRPGVVDRVAKALSDSGLPPALLTLEVTERAPLDPADAATRAALAGLREIGVGLALDDFGVGYATYAALGALPITAFKTDQAFIGLLGRGDRGLAVYRSFASLALAFELKLVVEGVETEAQRAALASAGCVWAQGHLFGAAAPPAAAEALMLSSGRAAAAS